ncbi:hypothetical protein TWF694_011312 [Orbilia ellipsospora]|uniref:Uncharacterized protein n=1 Tax=Orbilia ellipsospora TaxID=2528407 RepID=A0AAV9X4W2_9PEZI
MPFDFKKYDEKCSTMTPEELQLQWEHYTRLISGSATSTAVSGAALPLTMGVSSIGIALAAPAIHNARKKREIIEKHLNRHGTTHVTRKRDVLTSVAISGTIGVVTMGASSLAADAITNHAAEYGIQQVVEAELAVKVGTHLAFDAAAMGVEHAHTTHKAKKEHMKAHQMGKVASAFDSKQSQASQVPPDGFYPAVPIPQGYEKIGSEEIHNLNYAQATPQMPFSPLGQEYPPPPQYPGPPQTPGLARVEPQASSTGQYFPEKNEYVPPPPLPNFGMDTKVNINIVDGNSSEQAEQAPPTYAPPPPGSAPFFIDKKERITYQPAEQTPEQSYQQPTQQPTQQYPPPPIQPLNITTYPSYPGTMMDRAGPTQAIPTNQTQEPLSQNTPLSEMPIPSPSEHTPAQIPAPPSTSNVIEPMPQSIPPNFPVQNFVPPPPQPTSMPPPNQIPMNPSNISYPQPQQPVAQFVHRNSLPTPSTPATPAPYTPQTPVQNQIFNQPTPIQHQGSFPQQQGPVYQQSFPPPPPPPPPPISPQAYIPHVTSHPSFPPNSFPPPQAPAAYPMTPAQTPGPSYPQYIPAQHAPPTGYPNGYPTPLPTPFNSYSGHTGPQYPPEKQGFPQYQEVPIPGPQILSQQGQYMQSQPSQYQYQPTGYVPQGNVYGY